MIINKEQLLKKAPIVDMLRVKHSDPNPDGYKKPSYGLTEAGYDIRIAEEIIYMAEQNMILVIDGDKARRYSKGNFVLASAIEEFNMPTTMVGVVHDKSSWARKGLSVFNTVIEPGWAGFLTLELVFHAREDVIIPAGSGIAQVLFNSIAISAKYQGYYENQQAGPQGSKI